MSTVLVAIPVFKDGRRFHLEKGRRWTIVEHMLLEALAKADWTISDLTTASALPRRVVIEVVIRLMRAGWVELKIANGGVQFSTTPTGRLYATREDLPPVTRADVRYIGYIVELVTGSVFKIRDMTTLTEDQWKVRRSGREHAEVSAMLDMRSASPAIPVLAERLLDSDEQILRIDPKDFRPRRLFGLVTVRGKEIEGIGPNMPPALRRAILIAAGAPEADKGRSSGAAVGAGIATERAERETHTVTLRPDDFVFGGAKHRQALTDAIRLARHRIVLHSTFINEAQALEVVEQLKSAVLRGAIVDILWGQSVETAEGNRTRHAALALKAKLTADGLQDRIRVHMTTTRSHAKLVLSDTGDSDRFEALIGSCNWLSSDFLAFDVSLKLRDPGPVRELAWDLAELARPRDGQMPDLSVELFRLGRAVRAPDDVVGSRGTARVITATEHAALLAQARDQAQGAHYLSSAIVLVPQQSRRSLFSQRRGNVSRRPK